MSNTNISMGEQNSLTEEVYKLCDDLESYKRNPSCLSRWKHLNLGDFSELGFASFCDLLDSSEYFLGHLFESKGGGDDQIDTHYDVLYLSLGLGFALELTFCKTTYPKKAPGYTDTNLYVRGYVDSEKDLLVEVGSYEMGHKLAEDNNGNHPIAKTSFCRISKQPEHNGVAFALSTNESRIFEVGDCEQPETGGPKLLSEALKAVNLDELKQRFNKKQMEPTGVTK